MRKIDTVKPSGSNANMEELLKELGQNGNELLTEKGQRLPVDPHPKIHRELGELQLRISTHEGKKVTNKMLVTEALVDLFKKYERASNGEDVKTDYIFKPGDSFKTNL